MNCRPSRIGREGIGFVLSPSLKDEFDFAPLGYYIRKVVAHAAHVVLQQNFTAYDAILLASVTIRT